MLHTALLVVATLIIVFLIVVAIQPSTYRVVRRATIKAPANQVFPLVNNMRKWGIWSPWEKIDPAMERKFEGPAEGTGAIYSWNGNKKVGAGCMTVTESRSPVKLLIKLEFFRPMAGVCETEFDFEQEGEQTTVTWTMSGSNSFVAKAFCLFMNMDKMIGADFEKGLAALKAVSEASAKS